MTRWLGPLRAVYALVMDLHRFGRERQRRDVTELVDGEAPCFVGLNDKGVIEFSIFGMRDADRPNASYGYRVQMSPGELATIVAKAISDAGDGKSGEALAVLIRAALHEKTGRAVADE